MGLEFIGSAGGISDHAPRDLHETRHNLPLTRHASVEMEVTLVEWFKLATVRSEPIIKVTLQNTLNTFRIIRKTQQIKLEIYTSFKYNIV